MTGNEAPPAANLYERLTPTSGKNSSASKRARHSTNADVKLDTLLPLADGWTAAGDQTLEERLTNRVLQLREGKRKDNKPPATSKAAAAAAGKKSRKSVGKLKLSADEQKYALYEPMAALWTDYARGVAADANEKTIGERILRMDLHGALVEVVRSKDKGLIGKKGILIAETANTIMLATRGDRVVTVPKNVSVIRFGVGEHTVELMLPALCYRASERSAKKLKRCKMDSLLLWAS